MFSAYIASNSTTRSSCVCRPVPPPLPCSVPAPHPTRDYSGCMVPSVPGPLYYFPWTLPLPPHHVTRSRHPIALDICHPWPHSFLSAISSSDALSPLSGPHAGGCKLCGPRPPPCHSPGPDGVPADAGWSNCCRSRSVTHSTDRRRSRWCRHLSVAPPRQYTVPPLHRSAVPPPPCFSAARRHITGAAGTASLDLLFPRPRLYMNSHGNRGRVAGVARSVARTAEGRARCTSDAGCCV